MILQKTKKLNVHRYLSDGKQVLTGQLAQNSQHVFFQYDANYLEQYHSLSPFNLPFGPSLSVAPQRPHDGLHGVFSDSLPDGWGLLLMDRIFRQHGISPVQISAMDRLAYTGHQGMGALTYSPVLELGGADQHCHVSLATLGQQAIQLFEGQSDTVSAALAQAGGSGGARPKVLVYFEPGNSAQISTLPQDGYEPWLVKFTSRELMLGDEEGLCEAAWLSMAAKADIDVPQWRLLSAYPNPDNRWLAVKRFDCCPSKSKFGRYHMHSLAGLLDADFRTPSMDYKDLIKAGQVLCRSAAVGQKIFIRSLFNLFSLNQDDHAKNWSFLQDDHGTWRLAPFYDVTYSPHPHNQHMTAFGGHGMQPPLKVVQQLAAQANFSWKDAKLAIIKVVDAINQWPEIAKDLGVDKKLVVLIADQLNMVYKQNKGLLL